MNGSAYDLVFRPLELAGLSRLRSSLLSHAKGKTLEIGMGTGLNLPYYPEGVEVIGIEPDKSMRKRSMKRAQHYQAAVRDGDAMKLEFGDAEFDTVVGTLVLCSVPDPAKAIAEVKRVLKPGGQLLLLEHVRKNTPLAGNLLDLLTPLWKHIADGCHLNRDPSEILRREGFLSERYEILWGGLGKLWILRRPGP